MESSLEETASHEQAWLVQQGPQAKVDPTAVAAAAPQTQQQTEAVTALDQPLGSETPVPEGGAPLPAAVAQPTPQAGSGAGAVAAEPQVPAADVPVANADALGAEDADL